MIECGKCGQAGHAARECSGEQGASGRPAWCGQCDKQTRLVDHGDFMQRCHLCWAWPARGTRFHQLLPQHKICGGCEQFTYQWDQRPCGSHEPIAISTGGHRPPPPPPPEVAAITAAARQDLTKARETSHDPHRHDATV